MNGRCTGGVDTLANFDPGLHTDTVRHDICGRVPREVVPDMGLDVTSNIELCVLKL